MNKKESRFVKIVSDHLNERVEDIKPESRFADDLGADSLDLVEILMVFEEHFDCEVSDETAEKMATVQNVFDYIKSEKL